MIYPRKAVTVVDINLLVRRFIAFIIDWNVMFGVAVWLMLCGPGCDPEYILFPSIRMVTAPGFVLGLLWLPLYGLFKDCLFGRRSLGKMVCGLVIRSSKTGGKATVGSLILRNITYVIAEIEGIIVLLNNGQRLGDILAGTKVVKLEKKTPTQKRNDP